MPNSIKGNSFVDIVAQYNPDDKKHLIAYSKANGWYLTNKKSEAAKPQEIFKRALMEIVNLNDDNPTKIEEAFKKMNQMKIEEIFEKMTQIKEVYDKTGGIARHLFGSKNSVNASFKCLTEGKRILEEPYSHQHIEVKVEGQLIKVIDPDKSESSITVDDDFDCLKYVYYPNVTEIKFNSKNPTPRQLILLCKNFPNLQTIEYNNNKGVNYSIKDLNSAIKKTCLKFKGIKLPQRK